jgi:hypothetical protein
MSAKKTLIRGAAAGFVAAAFVWAGAAAAASAPADPVAPKAGKAAPAAAKAKKAKRVKNIGSLHPDVVTGAAKYAAVEAVKIRVDAAGAVKKLALYHLDASKLPAAVAKLAESKYKGAKVKRYELEAYADVGWVHEVEVELPGGKTVEVSAFEDGTIYYEETALKPSEIPGPIATAVKALLPGAKIVEGEAKKGPTVDLVQVEAKVGAVVHILHYKPTGGLLAHFIRVPAALDVPVP